MKKEPLTKPIGRTFKSVHDAHCCKVHGCKYGHDSMFGDGCPVVDGKEEGVRCEACDWEEAEFNEMKEKIKEVVREIIRDELRVTAHTNRSGYGSPSNAKDITITVELNGEVI